MKKDEELGKWFDKGIDYGERGQFELALENFNKVIKIDELDVLALYFKGICLEELGRYAEAINCYDNVLNIDSRLEMTWYDKGICLQNLKRYEDAINCYNKILDIYPVEFMILFDKGICLWMLGQLEESNHCFELAILQYGCCYPDSSISLLMSGLDVDTRIKEIQQSCYEVLKNDPNTQNNWHLWSLYKRLEKAINILEKMKELLEKVDSYEKMEKYKEAINCLDEIHKINPGNIDIWKRKSFLFSFIGQYYGAIQCCDQILAIDSKNADAWWLKGFLGYLPLGKIEEALNCFDEVLLRESQNRHLLGAVGEILLNYHQTEKALDCFNKSLEIDSSNANSWHDKGVALHKLNRFDEAIPCLDKAIEINPRYEGAWLSKGASLSMLDRHEEAILCDDKVLEINPQNVDAWNNKGIDLFALGHFEEAINYSDKVLEINSQHIHSLLMKAMCLMCLKRFEEANRCIDKAIAIDPSNDNLIKVKEEISICAAASNVNGVDTKIDLGDIPKVLSQEIGVFHHLLELEQYLKKRIIGQDKAIEHISQRIIMAHAGIIKRQGPLAVFLFLGPTGVGKTEMAKQLAKFLFGSETEMIRLDMSEYMEPHSVSKLTGSPPGYIGYEEDGQLTNKLFLKPNSVVLLDEIEKADTRVFDMFLQVFGEGRLTDAKGKTIDAKNSIFIMTSNILLPQEQNEDNSLFMFGTHGRKEKNIFDEPTILNELKKHFRPEFINRIDEIVIFDELNEESVKHILQIMIGDISDSLFSQHRVRLGFDNQAINTILKAGYNSEFGVRELRRTVERLIEVPLSRLIINEEIRKHSQWQVVCTEEGLSIIPID